MSGILIIKSSLFIYIYMIPSNNNIMNPMVAAGESAAMAGKTKLNEIANSETVKHAAMAGKTKLNEIANSDTVKHAAMAGKTKLNEIANSDTVKHAREGIGSTLTDLASMASDNKQHFSSLIFTIMDALNYSVVGGLQGLKVELENIVNDEKANSSGESSEGVEFIGECANFIAFFLDYIRINKGLKHSSTDIKEKDLDSDGRINKKNIEYLNNAFKHLAYTYGQLSGRTIYYLSKILQSGPVAEVGFFDPISFGSITTTLVKSSPVGGVISSVLDTVTNFFSALADAGKSSFKSLEEERKLAGEYMEYINTELGKPEQEGGRVRKVPEDTVETAILNKLHHPKSNKKYQDVGNFESRIEMLIKGKKTKHSAHSVELLTGADIQRQITEIETAMEHYNHVSSLVKLLEQLTKNTNTNAKDIYISPTDYDINSNDALEKLIPSEINALRDNETVKEEFKKMLDTFNQFKIESNKQDITIKESNIQLYNIVKDFIVNNYELYGNELGGLSVDIGFEPNEENEKEKDDIDAYMEDKTEKFTETLEKLTKIVEDEKDRIKKANEANEANKANANSGPETPYDYLKGERKKLKTKLTKLNSSKFDDVKSKVSASGNYKKYSSFLKQFKRDLKQEITSLKTTHVDGTKEAGSDAAQASTDLINSGLKKILTFIRIKDFGAINNMANQFDVKAVNKIAKLKARKKKYSDAFKAEGGGGRSSIRRRINSATRRIQTTLDSFNSTTRRNVRAKSKPRETRRQHYGH